jgi:hypothetical protein
MRSTILYLLTFVAVGPLLLAFQDENLVPVGVVVQMTGKWTVSQNSDRDLRLYDEILPDETVRTSKSTTNSIKVSMYDGTRWSWDCGGKVPRPCDGTSLALPSPPPSNAGLLWFFKRYFFEQKKGQRTIVTAGRGLNSTDPKSAVLVLAKTIDFSPALEGVPPNRYQLTLRDPNKPEDAGITREIAWPSSGSAVVGDIPSGVYSIELEDDRGERHGPAALVLLLKPKEAVEAQTKFSEMAEFVSHLDGADATTQRAIISRGVYALASGFE